MTPPQGTEERAGDDFLMGESLTTTSTHPGGPDPIGWETRRPLGTWLLRCDGQIGAVVDAEKNVVDPAVVSGTVTGQLELLAQQMGLGSGNRANGMTSSATGFGSVKPGFTREAGSFRRQAPSRAVQDPGRCETQ